MTNRISPLLALAILAPTLALASDTAISTLPKAAKVTLEAKGLPLCAVLAGLFDQAGVKYAVDPALDGAVYASVPETTLGEALATLGRLAEFRVRVEKGVVYAVAGKEPAPAKAAKRGLAKPPARLVPSNPFAGEVTEAPLAGDIAPQRFRASFPIGATKTILTKAIPVKAAPKPAPKPAPKAGKTPAALLAPRVSLKLERAEIAEVFAELARLSGTPIALGDGVPKYRVDFTVTNATLGVAMSRICRAAGLMYSVRSAGIVVSPKVKS